MCVLKEATFAFLLIMKRILLNAHNTMIINNLYLKKQLLTPGFKKVLKETVKLLAMCYFCILWCRSPLLDFRKSLVESG